MATITLTFTGPVALRLQAAFEETFRPEDENGIPIPADVAMLKGYIINNLKGFVSASEKRVALKAAYATVVDVDVE